MTWPDGTPAERGEPGEILVLGTKPQILEKVLDLREDGEVAHPLEVVGEVVAPVRGATPEKPMPLVLFLHGRHNTCYRGGPDGDSTTDWPCPPGWRPCR